MNCFASATLGVTLIAACTSTPLEGSPSRFAVGDVSVSSHGVEVYPGPGTDAVRSDRFSVDVLIGGEWVDAFTYQHRARGDLANYFPDQAPSVSWLTLGVPTNARVRVTYFGNPVISFDLTPYSIPTHKVGNSVEFEIRQGQKVFLRARAWFENSLFDTLALFANPPKPPVPEGALYFGPGMHDVGLDYSVPPDQSTLYLDGGAWVDGTLNFAGSRNPKILGPGVLSGRSWTFEELGGINLPWEEALRYHLVHSTDADGQVELESDFQMLGPTLVAAPLNNATLFGTTIDVDHVHVIAPWHSADCLYLGGTQSVTITNTFCFNNDDSFAPEYSAVGPIRYGNNVILGRTSFIIGYGYWQDSETYGSVTAEDLDIIHPRFVRLGTTGAVFRAAIDAADSGILVKNQHYRNITIHGDTPRLVEMAITDTGWGAPTPAQGNIENITFENVRILGSQWWRSEIRGKDPQNMIRDITFINLQIGGVYVDDSNYEHYFDIGPYAENIRFLVTE